MKRILLLVALALCLCTQSWAKIVIVDEISFPIESYMSYVNQGKLVPLSPSGVLRVRLHYADTFSNPDNNSYSINFHAYSDNSRRPESGIFSSVLSGRSQNEVDRNSWGKNTWREKRNIKDKGIKHYIALSNGFWETRCCLMDIGKIIITYGKLNEELSLDMGKASFLREVRAIGINWWISSAKHTATI